MTEVMVERIYPEPLTDEVLNRNLENALPCLNLHRVQWRRSFLSVDRRELACHFTARDAESVRLALQQAGAQRGLVWTCTVHDAPGIAEADLLEAGVYACCAHTHTGAGDTVPASGQDEAMCLVTHRVTTVRTYVSNDQRRMIGIYRAPDAESVRLALRGASRPVERVWACRHLLP